MKFETIEGGVCAAKGFLCNGVHCGIRKNKAKKDLALVVAEKRCAAAAVYTQNLVKGAPITVTKRHIADGYARAIVVNSGNANTCNANGEEIAEEMCRLVEKHTGVKAEDVIVASTGVIGQPLDIAPIAAGMEGLAAGLGKNNDAANEAIMTTDTVKKQAAVRFSLGGKECVIGCMAKGSGMIHPNMATMLVFVTTDAAISPAMLQKAVSEDAKISFNRISIDGDTSTNDMLCALASGEAGNALIDGDGEDFRVFKEALHVVTVKMCRMIAKDGEGATKLLECRVSGAKSEADAEKAAKGVISSSLFKAAMFGADANWGRVLCAIGYSGADVNVNKVGVCFSSRAGSVKVCEEGAGIPFSEEVAKKVLSEDEIVIEISLQDGNASAAAWGCDLTYDYVKINGDYRT